MSKGDDVGVGVVLVVIGLLGFVFAFDNPDLEIMFLVGPLLILFGIIGIRQSLNRDN
ncbi:hypothetical protein [Natronorubrum bangense]|uniref:hypothetical protein n=1 Tax=Natronorubrum bangense TaxID=61858 RepID=UPI00137597C5|nr:hypothetical protein [Natronorubrum bangense]